MKTRRGTTHQYIAAKFLNRILIFTAMCAGIQNHRFLHSSRGASDRFAAVLFGAIHLPNVLPAVYDYFVKFQRNCTIQDDQMFLDEKDDSNRADPTFLYN